MIDRLQVHTTNAIKHIIHIENSTIKKITTTTKYMKRENFAKIFAIVLTNKESYNEFNMNGTNDFY